MSCLGKFYDRAREDLRSFRADIRDSERDEHTIERRMSRFLESIFQILNGFFFISFECKELCFMIEKMKRRCKIREPSLLEKKLDLLLAETIDIESMLSEKCLETPLNLRRTMMIWTEKRDLLLFFLKECITHRATCRKCNNPFVSVSRLRDRRDNLRDHFSGADDIDHISFTNIFFLEFIVVMERRATDDHTADIHRLEIGDWRHHTRPSDRMLDREDFRADLIRRKLICSRVSWMMLRRPKYPPETEIITFYHESIGIIRKSRARRNIFFLIKDFDQRFDTFDVNMWKISRRKTERLDILHERRIGGNMGKIGIGRETLLNLRDAIRKKKKTSSACYERIELTE